MRESMSSRPIMISRNLQLHSLRPSLSQRPPRYSRYSCVGSAIVGPSRRVVCRSRSIPSGMSGQARQAMPAAIICSSVVGGFSGAGTTTTFCGSPMLKKRRARNIHIRKMQKLSSSWWRMALPPFVVVVRSLNLLASFEHIEADGADYDECEKKDLLRCHRLSQPDSGKERDNCYT